MWGCLILSEVCENNRSIVLPKVFNLGVVLPVVFAMGCWLFPVLQMPLATLICFVALFVFHFHVCVSLTFDGFVRFSRYRLSQKHLILDKILSVSMILGCFLGLSVYVLFLNAYSLWVSPDKPEREKNNKLYNKAFVVPLMQGFALSVFLLKIISVVAGNVTG